MPMLIRCIRSLVVATSVVAAIWTLNTSLTANTIAQAAALAPTAPIQPLQAWSIGPDGSVWVLDAAHSVHRLDPDRLTSIARSAPLTPSFSGGPAYLLATEDGIWVGSPQIGKTLFLNPATFETEAALDVVGPMALDPGRRLFVMNNRSLVGYELSNLENPPLVLLRPWSEGQFMGEIPLTMTSAPEARRLYVTLFGQYGSPPHNPELLWVYDLDTYGRSQIETIRGHFARPAWSGETSLLVTSLQGRSGTMASHLRIRTPDGVPQREGKFLDGEIAVSPDGQWIYLLQPKGLWVIQSSDLSLSSIFPFNQQAPVSVLAPDNDRVYLFGNGWTTVLSTSYLRELGIAATGPLPPVWSEETGSPRYYLPPEFAEHKIAFAVDNDGDLYRSEDGALSWRPIVALRYPMYQTVVQLSISPNFAQDGTIVARTSGSGGALMRTTDYGLTWSSWTPPLAFTSDRSGNREIYVANSSNRNREETRIALAEISRLTDHPGSDENPAWSPGWTNVVFQSNRNGNWDLYHVRADCVAETPHEETSCTPIQLTDSSADDMLPAWSPDGTRLAFVSTRDGNPELYILELASLAASRSDKSALAPEQPAVRRLTHSPGGDWRPAWNATGSLIYFTTDRTGTNDIFHIEVPSPTGYWPTADEPLSQPVVSTPADERDPAVNSNGDLLFLSDQDGSFGIWRLTAGDVRPYSKAEEPYTPYNRVMVEGRHPAWWPLDMQSGILLTVQTNSAADIAYLPYLRSTPADPIITSDAFDGHPTGGPVFSEGVPFLP